ncbi:MAG: UvrD-helicase domain-containing protein [Bacteroidaceae bacterium]|nr:UvrD-helicase domain-containing protein [Bacteroidaceae bacterium]
MNNGLIVYKASAGSGKTFTLAVEYLALLLSQVGSEGFRHILAVTFTNMATAEMKGRILEYLYQLAQGKDETIRYEVIRRMEGDCPRDEIELKEKARQCLTAILHDYSHFRVETIDAFLQSVLRNMAHELGLNANLRVELDDKSLVDKAVDYVIDNLHDGRTDKVKVWIRELLSAQLDAGNAWDVASAVKSFASCIFDEAFLNRTTDERKALRDEAAMNRFVREMRTICTDSERSAAEIAERALAAWQAIDLKVSYSADYEKMIQRMARMEALNMSPRINTALYEDSTTLLRKADAERTAEAESIAAMLREACEDYLHHYRLWLSAKLAMKDINQLRLLGLIEDTAEAIAEENNQFALSKTPSLLSQLIGRDDAPFVFEKAGTTFHHVMIDEFQDTSQMQWSNFRVLLLENLATQGHDLVVGDVKQSIYRWRNGDWRILQQMEHNAGLPIKPKVFTLDINYRSEQRIVDFNNDFFDAAAKALDNIAPHQPRIADLYADVKQLCAKSATKGYIEAHLFLNTASNDAGYWRQTALEMAGRIDELTQLGVEPSRIAILVREKSDGVELIRQFREIAPHILLVSDESYQLEASTAVQLIIAAMRCLNDSADRISEAFLKKYDCALPDGEERKELLAQPLYLLCESLFRLLHLERLAGQEAYVMTFLDEVQEYSRNGTADLRTFLKTWDETIYKVAVPCGAIPGVQILTIHKSKGLQFHTVLLPATHWKINKHTKDDKLWMYASDARFNQIGPLPIIGKKELADSFYAEEYAEEMFQKRVDALNILYVAFTRTECNLMIWGAAQTKDKKGKEKEFNDESGAGEILYRCFREMPDCQVDEEAAALTFQRGELVGRKQGRKEETSRMSMQGQESISIPLRSYPPSFDFRQSIESQKFVRDLTSEETQPLTYTDIGKLMHFVLSQIETVDDIQRVLQQCEAQGIVQDERMRQRAMERLKQGFKNSRVKEWFSAGNTIINECNIIGSSIYHPGQQTHRPDRVIVRGQTLTVVDYKFARPCQEHIAQVQAYMDLLRQMYPTMTVEGYLWYVYSGHIETVKNG